MDGKFFENNLFAVAGDTGRRLEVQLLDSDNMIQNTTGISLRLNANVAGQATYAEATLVDATKGLYELDLPNGMLIAPGNWQFQWQIIGATGEKLHSFAFTGSVGSNLSEGGSEATNFYLNLEDLKAMQEDLVNGSFDSSILETNIAEKLTDLETQYAPKLTELTAQLAQTETELTAQLAQNENRPYLVKQVQNTAKTPKPIVVFTFDDGGLQDYTVMKPLFDEFGYKPTTYIVPNFVGKTIGTVEYMSKAQITELYNDGWEIASHTMNHLAMGSSSAEVIEYEMAESKRVLESWGFEPNNFAYPYGSKSNLSGKIARKYYRTATLFMSEIKPNTVPIQKVDLERKAMGSYYDIPTTSYPITDTFSDYYKYWVDDALTNNNLTIFALHPWKMYNDAAQMQYLRQTLQYCKDNNVNVMTLDNALEYFDNQLDLRIYNEDNTVKSDITFDANGELSSGGGRMIFSTHAKTKINQTALPSSYPKGFSRMEMNDENFWTLFSGAIVVYTDNSTKYPDTVRQWVYQKWNTGISYRSARSNGTWTDFVNLTPKNKFALLAYKPVSTSFDLAAYTTVVYDVPNSVLPWQSVVVANSKVQLPKGVEYTVWNNAGQQCKLQITNTSPTVQRIPDITEFNIKEV